MQFTQTTNSMGKSNGLPGESRVAAEHTTAGFAEGDLLSRFRSLTLSILSCSFDRTKLGQWPLNHQPLHRLMIVFSTPRSITPRRLVHRGGATYLIAFCHIDSLEKSFRLDRIRSVQLTFESDPDPVQVDRPAARG